MQHFSIGLIYHKFLYLVSLIFSAIVGGKTPKFFPALFFGLLKIKCFSKCLNFIKACLPSKNPGCMPAGGIFVIQLSISLMTSQWDLIFIALFFHCSHAKIFCCTLLFLLCYFSQRCI